MPAIDDVRMAGTFPEDVPTLSDGEVTLRAHALSDVDAMVEQCVDEDSITWTVVPVPYSKDDAVQFATKIVPAGWQDGKEFSFAIEAAHTDGVRRFAGSVSLTDHGDGVAELAYGLHPGARGGGVCSRAVKLLLDWGFQQKGYAVVVWYAHVGNWGSRRVAWANGFSIDGMVSKFLVQRGVRRDAWVGSLRADDTREPKTQWLVAPVLESDRLRLRPLADTDAERFTELMFDERSRHFSGRVKDIADLDGPALILRAREAAARGERFDWAIADQETDRMIGHIQLFDLDGLDDSSAGLGYGVHPDSRGRGVLTESLGIVTEWAFRPVTEGGLGRRRLYAGTAGSNRASRHGLERAGFAHAATLPGAFTSGVDGFEDEVIYHRLNPSWTPPPKS